MWEEEMDDGRWPHNQAVDISEGDQLGYAPLPFTFQQPETAPEVHGCLIDAVIKKGLIKREMN